VSSSRLFNAGRPGLRGNSARARLMIAETRAAPITFRFDAWDDDDAETVIVVTSTTLIVSPELFRFDHAPVASVPLHSSHGDFREAGTCPTRRCVPTPGRARMPAS
jgi:hypothetical protein